MRERTGDSESAATFSPESDRAATSDPGPSDAPGSAVGGDGEGDGGPAGQPPVPDASTEPLPDISDVVGATPAPATAAPAAQPTIIVDTDGDHDAPPVEPAPTGSVPSVAISNAAVAATTLDSLPAVTARQPGDRPSPPRRRRRVRAGLLVLFGLLPLFVGGWALDLVRTSGRVQRNVVLGTTPIGGLDEAELDAVIDGLDADLALLPVTVSVEGTDVDTDAATLGAELDREALVEVAMMQGRNGSGLLRPFQWIGSFFGTTVIDPVYTVDEARAGQASATVITTALDAPIEPTLILRGSDLVVEGGAPGQTVDPAQLVALLPVELEDTGPISVDLDPVATEPALTDEAVQAVAGEASSATQDPVRVRVLDKAATVATVEMRSWVLLDAEGAEPTWVIDVPAAADHLQGLFPALGSEDQKARFTIVDGEPIILPASETVICCDEDSIAGMKAALLAPLPPPEEDGEGDDSSPAEGGEDEPARVVTLEPRIVGSDTGVAELESLGIVEEVSTFTTNHACCQNRVANIQRFADLMTGVIIRPGEDFSLNEFVGRRTTEKGFVADGAIIDGILEPQVGGGISQFATTFFNAAFFAGLDFNEYQSHSLYISRYPRGREATISWPKPDLSVKNTTPYGVLVWPTYTPTSITVTFYSTKHIDVEALELRSSSRNQCTVYTTPRVRTYPDGSSVEDSVFALYRPGEGLDCNGDPTRPEEEPAGPPSPSPASPADDSAGSPEPDPQPAPDTPPTTEAQSSTTTEPPAG